MSKTKKLMAQNSIKAIDTFYKGYKFRSRLEARWAVYFETLNLKWLYESEGYKLSTGEMYLPDFFLPDFNIYVEIKPENYDWSDTEKHRRFITEIGARIVIFAGIPGDGKSLYFQGPSMSLPKSLDPIEWGGCDPYIITPSLVNDPQVKEMHRKMPSFHGFKNRDLILKAIGAAKSARF